MIKPHCLQHSSNIHLTWSISLHPFKTILYHSISHTCLQGRRKGGLPAAVLGATLLAARISWCTTVAVLLQQLGWFTLVLFYCPPYFMGVIITCEARNSVNIHFCLLLLNKGWKLTSRHDRYLPRPSLNTVQGPELTQPLKLLIPPWNHSDALMCIVHQLSLDIRAFLNLHLII